MKIELAFSDLTVEQNTLLQLQLLYIILYKVFVCSVQQANVRMLLLLLLFIFHFLSLFLIFSNKTLSLIISSLITLVFSRCH